MGFGGVEGALKGVQAKLTQRWGAGQGGFLWFLPTPTPPAAFASRIFCSLVGGFLEVLCQCGKAWEALIIFCNFWKIPATSDFQNFY